MEERVFTINIRRAIIKTPRWKNSNKAISVIREHLKQHMKTDNIRIGKTINERIWSRGDQKPPGKIKIKAIKTQDDDGNDIVKAEMWGQVFEEELKEEPEKKTKQKETKKS